MGRGLLTDEQAIALESSAKQEIEAAAAFALDSPDLQPDELFSEVYA